MGVALNLGIIFHAARREWLLSVRCAVGIGVMIDDLFG